MTTTDDIAQMTFLGKDDLAWRKERKRQRAEERDRKKIEEHPPELPEGRCCAKCLNWRRPMHETNFGRCIVLAITTERLRGGYGMDKGYVLLASDAMKIDDLEWDSLRTRGWYEGCRAYRDPNEEAA